MLRTVEFVSALAGLGMEVAESVAVPDLVQPVVVSTGVVSLWRYYDIDPDCRVTPGELGGLLRHFHDLVKARVDLVDEWEPFELIRPRLAAARRDGIDGSLLELLEARLAALESSVPGLTSELGTGVIHGDVHYGNVMCLPDHHHLLIDFDQIARGPLEWDLVPSLVTHMRCGMPDEDLDSFVAAYGYDLRKSTHVSTFVALRELGMVTWLLQQYGTNAAVDEEIRLRIRTMGERGPRATTWRAR